jgi:hypothetical protein
MSLGWYLTISPLHRLDKIKKDEIRVVTYDQEALAAAIKSDFEVR